MSVERGSTWDPNVVGPIDRCLRCWTPIRDAPAYCQTCGKTTPLFNTAVELPVNKSCFYHQERAAACFCCACVKPICSECQAYKTTPFSLMLAEVCHCRNCVDSAGLIEKEYFKRLEKDGCCAKHSDILASFQCKKCALPLCLSCSYFSSVGFLRKRIGDGPFCVACFRRSFTDTKHKAWFSGHDLAPALVR
jgi:hypothetical protein